MKKYFKFSLALLNISLKHYLENRWNTLGFLLPSFLNLILTILFINIFFSFTRELNGWNKNQVFLLLGFYYFINPFFSFLFVKSLQYMPDYIRKGDLDLLLSKPVSSQFYISFRHIRIYKLLECLPGLVVIFYCLNRLQNTISLGNWILLSVGLVTGLVIFYGLYFSIATLSFWLGRFSAFPEFYYMATQFIGVPVDILGKRLSFVMTFIIPLGFILTIPLKIFLNMTSVYPIFIGVVFAFFSLGFSIWFWNFSLKHYTSASS